MANKIFRQVLCSERLPKEDGMYIAQSWKGICRHEFNLVRHTLNKHTSDWLNEIEWWLEEVELPNEVEIEVIIDNLLIERGEHFSRVRNPLYGEERILAHNTFTKAIELIKGEGLNNG